MLPIEEYEALRDRPAGRPAMSQSWRDLSFLHFSADPGEIQRLIPDGLLVDTFPDIDGEERAYVGLVPFRMENVTPYRVPPVPGCHAFPETNVRTYVHREGRKPGVWFFSLDASNGLACRVARSWFSLPYRHASMSLEFSEHMVRYKCGRYRADAHHDITVDIGDPLPAPMSSLEFFLVERYLLYAARDGGLHTGRVFHKPYPLQRASLEACDENMVEAAGIVPGEFTNVAYSAGVDVEVFPLERIQGSQ